MELAPGLLEFSSPPRALELTFTLAPAELSVDLSVKKSICVAINPLVNTNAAITTRIAADFRFPNGGCRFFMGAALAFNIDHSIHKQWKSRRNITGLCTKSRFRSSSLCNLCVLCASVVKNCSKKTTTETQRTQRLHREELGNRLFGARLDKAITGALLIADKKRIFFG